jgi:hypothetical protein
MDPNHRHRHNRPVPHDRTPAHSTWYRPRLTQSLRHPLPSQYLSSQKRLRRRLPNRRLSYRRNTRLTLDLYRTKFQRCGGGRVAAMSSYCNCDDCEKTRYGVTRKRHTFWIKQWLESVKEMRRKMERDDEEYTWAGLGAQHQLAIFFDSLRIIAVCYAFRPHHRRCLYMPPFPVHTHTPYSSSLTGTTTATLSPLYIALSLLNTSFSPLSWEISLPCCTIVSIATPIAYFWSATKL